MIARMLAAGLVASCSLASSQAIAAPEGPGWRAYDLGHFDAAVTLWRQSAAWGDADAAFGLGIAYDLGRGVPQDNLAACDWYARAGAQGHSAAAFNAAVMHDSGRCGPRRADAAATWYARAAATGSARAQFDLAQLYAAGDGVPRNPDQAVAWYRVAAANGVKAAADRVPRSSPASIATGPLLPVAPISPDSGLDGGDERQAVTLVWAAPAQPEPVRFLVELCTVTPAGPKELLARTVDVSATQVILPPGAAQYAWRVLTVGTRSPHYAVGPWRAFATAETVR